MKLFSWLEIIFAFCSTSLIGYYLFFWGKLLLYTSKNQSFSNLPFVTVIICAKNEKHNLKKFMPSILGQEYPLFEVIVVNDGSSDGSMEVLSQLLTEHNHLRVYSFNENKTSYGKKEVLEFGIRKAKSEYLVLTDADCRPNTKQWLAEMVNGFSDGSEIVLGVGQYEKEDSILNKLIQLDTGFIAMNYLSFALANLPYMSVGRNVAYKKELFHKVGGFQSHYDIPSGDDDLFINELSKDVKVAIAISLDSQTISVPKENFKSFFFQKVRHVSSGLRYNKRNSVLLSFFYSLSVVWYLLLPVVIYYSNHLFVISTIIILKKLTMYSLIRRIFIKIGVIAKSRMVLIAEFCSVFIHDLAVLVTIFKSKKGKW